ncbi:MAG: hypothetical protein KDD51_17115, partial [Bdellovibrionales bacterium]|nr:hypothetical protein [Bdellovibrionales bacterium]
MNTQAKHKKPKAYRHFRLSWVWTNQWVVATLTFVTLLSSVELYRNGATHSATLLVAGLVLYLQRAYFSLHYRSLAAAQQSYRQVEQLFNIHAALQVRTPLPQMRNWAISPDMGSFLIATAQEHRPHHIVELGSGISTLILATIAKAWGGKVLTF